MSLQQFQRPTTMLSIPVPQKPWTFQGPGTLERPPTGADVVQMLSHRLEVTGHW